MLPVFLSLLTSAIVLGTAWGKLSEGFRRMERRFDEKFEDLKGEFRDLRNDLKDFEKDMNCKLSEHDKDIAGLKVRAYGTPGSPMKLTEIGKELLEDSGFNLLYPKIKADLFSIMDDLKTNTLYDAEKNAYSALCRLKSCDEFIDVKYHAVNNPDEPLELIFTVASWIIRDDYAMERGIER